MPPKKRRALRIGLTAFLALAGVYCMLWARASYASHLFDVCERGYNLQVPDQRMFGGNGTWLVPIPVTYVLPARMKHCELVVVSSKGEIHLPLNDCSPGKHTFTIPSGIRTANGDPLTWSTNVDLNCRCYLPWWLFVKIPEPATTAERWKVPPAR